MAVGLVVGNTSKIDLIIGISKKEKIELWIKNYIAMDWIDHVDYPHEES